MPEPVAPAPLTNDEQEMRRLQIEKLRLEVQSLASQRRKQWITYLVPLVSACIAIGGLWITANQFFVQQTKDRAERAQQQLLREESQVRVDLEQLLSLPRDEGRSARVTQLLDDLVGLTETLPNERQRVTNVLLRFIMDDADFDNIKDIRIETAAFDNWKPYAEQLKIMDSEHKFVVYKYLQSLRHLHDSDPKYFETIQYDSSSGFRVRRFEKENVYVHFLALAQGLFHHVLILQTDQQTTIKAFEAAINNAHLTRQLFGTSSTIPLGRDAGSNRLDKFERPYMTEEYRLNRKLYLSVPRQRLMTDDHVPRLRQSR